jgi:hypothetical protein
MEARVQLPGDHFASGFWPAFWVMGNLARAGGCLSPCGRCHGLTRTSSRYHCSGQHCRAFLRATLDLMPSHSCLQAT